MIRHCRECGEAIREEGGGICRVCGATCGPSSGTRLVPVLDAESMPQAGMIRAILEGRRIPCNIRGEYGTLIGVGMAGDLGMERGGIVVEVPDHLEARAREILCGAGIACRIEPGEVETVLRDHALPAMRQGIPGAGDLVPVLVLNKREVVTEIVLRIASEDLPFAEAVLVQACVQGEAYLAGIISRAIDEMHVPDLPGSILSVTEGRARAIAAGAVARMRRHEDETVRALVSLLEDPDEEVRTEAIEGLFSITETTLDYEPDAPEEEREKAVERWKKRGR
jgi:hypothetical protein